VYLQFIHECKISWFVFLLNFMKQAILILAVALNATGKYFGIKDKDLSLKSEISVIFSILITESFSSSNFNLHYFRYFYPFIFGSKDRISIYGYFAGIISEMIRDRSFFRKPGLLYMLNHKDFQTPYGLVKISV